MMLSNHGLDSDARKAGARQAGRSARALHTRALALFVSWLTGKELVRCAETFRSWLRFCCSRL